MKCFVVELVVAVMVIAAASVVAFELSSFCYSFIGRETTKGSLK